MTVVTYIICEVYYTFITNANKLNAMYRLINKKQEINWQQIMLTYTFGCNHDLPHHK